MRTITPENWKLKIIRTDRNEIRAHITTGLISVFYRDREGLDIAYRFAKRNLTKEVALGLADEYKKLRIQGA